MRRAAYPSMPSPTREGREPPSRSLSPPVQRIGTSCTAGKQGQASLENKWPKTQSLCSQGQKKNPHVSSWEDSHQRGGEGSGWTGLRKLILASHPFGGGGIPQQLMMVTAEVVDTHWDPAPATLALLEAGWILEVCPGFGLCLVPSPGWGSRPRHSPCSRCRTSSRAAAAAPGAG